MGGDFVHWAAFILAAAIMGSGLAVATRMVVTKDKRFAIVVSVAALWVWFVECSRLYVLGPRTRNTAVATLRTRELDQKAFDDLTIKIINAAISDGVVPNDAICATARALGVLVAFTARRENIDRGYLLAFAREETGEYSKNAEGFMLDNRGLWDRYALDGRPQTEVDSALLYGR